MLELANPRDKDTMKGLRKFCSSSTFRGINNGVGEIGLDVDGDAGLRDAQSV